MTAIAASVHIIQIRLLHTRSVKVFSILIAALILGGVIGVMASLFYYPSQPSPLQYNIVSESGDNSNSLPVVFQNATNLTNNPMDSVYGQVAAWNNNVYMLWQDSMSPGFTNYDIFIKSSNDNGINFGSPVNLSDNPGFSEHPQIAATTIMFMRYGPMIVRETGKCFLQGAKTTAPVLTKLKTLATIHQTHLTKR